MFVHRHYAAAVLGLGLAGGLLTGCVSVNSGPGAPPTATVAAPPPPTIPVDTTKSLDEQFAELKSYYCKLRQSAAGEAVTTTVKEAWNKLAAEATSQGVKDVPTFDPGDPKMCQ